MPHRRRSRVEAHFRALVTCRGQEFEVWMHNLSLTGMKFRQPDETILSAGDVCKVRIPLADNVEVQAEATVARTDEHLAALDFTAIDPDSYPHLLNMVRYASENPDAIEEEQLRIPFDESASKDI